MYTMHALLLLALGYLENVLFYSVRIKLKSAINNRCWDLCGRIPQCPVCLLTLSLQCSGSVLVNISLRGGANPHYVRVSSTVNCQPFVCLSIHLIANNHYPALSSWQMIDVVLMSDGWPCHSDVQACIKTHLYERPVSLMKRCIKTHTRVCTHGGPHALWIKEKMSKLRQRHDSIQQLKTKVNFFILAENFVMWQDLWCDR